MRIEAARFCSNSLDFFLLNCDNLIVRLRAFMIEPTAIDRLLEHCSGEARKMDVKSLRARRVSCCELVQRHPLQISGGFGPLHQRN